MSWLKEFDYLSQFWQDTKKKSKQSQQCRRLTNEELFYDPHMDEEDEQWVKRQRMAYHNGTGGRPDTPCPQLNLSNLDSFVLDKGSQLVGCLDFRIEQYTTFHLG